MLLFFKLQPQVIMYTNAVLSLFSTMCAVALSLVFNTMPYDYFLASLIASIIGAAPGIKLQSYIVQKTGKAQYSLMGFNLIVLLCLVSVTAYQATLINMKKDDGYQTWKRNSYCLK